MVDECSSLAYDKINRSGKKQSDADAILKVFMDQKGFAITAREVLYRYLPNSKIGLNGIRSRITELTNAGFLIKQGKVLDIDNRCVVNSWAYTGKLGVLPPKTRWSMCRHCEGRGKVRLNAE